MSLRQLIVEVASALGISTLKSQQSEAIFQFLHGRDVFVALPTGYGKSLCYMALPWIFDRLRGVTNQSVVLVVGRSSGSVLFMCGRALRNVMSVRL